METEISANATEEKIRLLVASYGTMLLRLCYAYLKDASLAEDATQETFIKAFKKVDAFTPLTGWSEKAWIIKIAINTCKDIRRSNWFRNVDRRFEPDDSNFSSGMDTNQSTIFENVLSLSMAK